ncbi:hypothetical protein ANRL3_01503 [Anaerolineae bacterium]|nr:hypothetical protein ANRL3_01503 [Anaerolineae bacterium]
MMLNALVVEQLEEDGTLKTLTLNASGGFDNLVVAFADEYFEPREGPFHFLESRHEDLFAEKWAQCHARRVGEKRLQKSENEYHYSTNWRGIPTRPNELSLYTFSLPMFGVLVSLRITSPHIPNPDFEFERSVVKDDQKNRFIIYIPCRSSMGLFDFDLDCVFRVDHRGFGEAKFRDNHTKESSNTFWYNDYVDRIVPDNLPNVREFFTRGSIKKQMGKIKVFISYAHKDQSFVQSLDNELAKYSIEVWYDRKRGVGLQGGDTWEHRLESELGSSTYVLVVLSSASTHSGSFVENEYQFALNKSVRVIPLLLEDCQIPLSLTKYQYVDFAHQNFSVALTQLLTALNMSQDG